MSPSGPFYLNRKTGAWSYPRVDSMRSASRKYRLIHESLDAAEFPPWKTPIIVIFPTRDPLVRDVRRRFAKAKSVEGMRLGGQMIGDRFIEDAYVYRIS